MGSTLLTCGAGLIALFAVRGPLVTSLAWDSQPGQQASIPARHVFGSDAGMVLNFIKADKTADFESIVGRLKQALQKSTNPDRLRQAKGWKVFRAVEPAGNGAVLYLFVIDPAVPGADYTVSTILAEAYPDEVQTLYKQYAEAYASGQNIVNLTTLPAFAVDVSSTK